MRSSSCYGAALALITAAVLTIVESPAGAQSSSLWLLRAEGGFATIHDGSPGPVWGAAASRRLSAGGATRLDFGLYVGRTQERFLLFNPGLELHISPGRRVTPFVAGHVGLLGEPEWAGVAPNVGTGLVAGLGAFAVRATAGLGVHGRRPGPHTFRVGVGMSSPD
jgi:hypothetical protein